MWNFTVTVMTRVQDGTVANLLHMEEMHYGLKGSDWKSMEWT